MNLAEEFTRTLRETAWRLGVELNTNLDEVQAYAAEQMAALALTVDEPGYSDILEAAGLNVILKAAGEAVESADAIDRELYGTVIGLLGMGARALAGVA